MDMDTEAGSDLSARPPLPPRPAHATFVAVLELDLTIGLDWVGLDWTGLDWSSHGLT